MSPVVSPLAPPQLEALRSLRSAYPEARIAMIGAAALGFRIKMTWRNTADLDLVIAVAVSEIDASKLPGWEHDRYQQQRWKTPDGVLIDLVPAPPEALAQRELVWPETGHKMNVAGLGLALDAETSLLDADLAIAVPSVPVIALLKMAAYADRPFQREKDLRDLAHILNEYPAPNEDRLFAEEIFDAGIDAASAQAFILGQELSEICGELDRDLVIQFLNMMSDDSPHWSRFVGHSPWRYDEEKLQRKLDALRAGFGSRHAAPPVVLEPSGGKIPLLFVVNGEEARLEVARSAPLRAAIEVVLAQTKNTGRRAEEWELRNDKGESIDPSGSPNSLGLAPGAVLYLTLRVGAGGDVDRPQR